MEGQGRARRSNERLSAWRTMEFQVCTSAGTLAEHCEARRGRGHRRNQGPANRSRGVFELILEPVMLS